MRKTQKTAEEQNINNVPTEVELTSKKHPGGRPSSSDADRIRMGQLIKKYRTEAKMDQAVLAQKLGCCTGNAVAGWEAGRYYPALPVIPKLCAVLNIPLHDLIGMEAPIPALPKEDERHLNNYHSLSQYNQQSIDQLILRMFNEQEQIRRQTMRQTTGRLLRVDELSPAAGYGIPALDNVETETVYMRRSWAFDHSDLITKVSGDSMYPLYPDGCLIFVNRQEKTPLGEVGIFLVDGQYFIKERREEGLYSLNTKRPNVIFTEDMDVRHYGRVMGRVDERDFFSGDELDEVRAAWEIAEES